MTVNRIITPGYTLVLESSPPLLRVTVSGGEDTSLPVTADYWLRIAAEVRATGARQLLFIDDMQGEVMTDADLQRFFDTVNDAGIDDPTLTPAALEIRMRKASEGIRDYLNRYLPDAIAVREVKEAAPRFHARYNALGKTYRYTCFDGPVKPVFDRKYVTLLDYRPDVERMQQAAAYLTGEHDFASFCGNPRMKKSTVRLVDSITVERRKDRVIFTFHGTGFLQNMVRILVGTLLEVGRGYWEPEYVQEILLAKDRKRAGPTAPPEGLCLMKVDY